MAKSEPIFNVVVSGTDVSIDRLLPKNDGYAQAKENVIFRERDAIEVYQGKQESGASQDGVYSFQTLNNAKSFALLQLKSIEQAIEDNLDRIQAYTDH
jgi:hypothetical protein